LLMSQRVAESVESAIPARRERLEEVATSPTSLVDINNDCILLILKCLAMDDLNSIAICGRRYCYVRGHELLDQTRRRGTIVCSQNTKFESIRIAFARQEWNEVFSETKLV
jgi:hypothetical protein